MRRIPLGRFWRQFAPRLVPRPLQDRTLTPSWLKMSMQGSVLGLLKIGNQSKTTLLNLDRYFWPSKNGLQKGVRKKRENVMKKRCKIRCFLMAQNDVWRYTLRLFHTFGLFEKSKKSMEKGTPKVIVGAER